MDNILYDHELGSLSHLSGMNTAPNILKYVTALTQV